MIKSKNAYLFTISIFHLLNLNAQERISSKNTSEELGQVNWYRDYDQALAIAKKEKKAILILFQEVPGCATCRNYGHNVLSHPLMVEAIENSFVPLAIFNNKGGKDKVILNKYNEPSWNNPVVRIINTNEENIVKRIGGDYSAITLCKRMKESLVKKGAIIPEYLNLLEQELLSTSPSHTAEKHYKMYCFWTGEKQLGKLDGVVSTESGFIGNNEVVKVKYDPNKINEKQLDNYSSKYSFEPIVNINYKKSSNDIHYYLQHSNYKYLPLTELQKTKINSALGRKESPQKYLSPKQKKWLLETKNQKNRPLFLSNTSFMEAWSIKEK